MTAVLDIARNSWPITPADSARLVENVYTASLLITLPIIVSIVALLVLRNHSAGVRSLALRAGIVAMLLVFCARALPHAWTAWILPEMLSEPLVMLGRLQVGAIGNAVSLSRTQGDMSSIGIDSTLVVAVLGIYLTGVFVVLAPTLVSLAHTRRLVRRATALRGRWPSILAALRDDLGVRRDVSILVSRECSVPVTLGVLHPVILVPASLKSLPVHQRRAVLLHELAHIRSFDWLFALAGRLTCALYWFHPGVWWISRRLGAEFEVACDDRVLASGIRASDYAELLVLAADRAHSRVRSGDFAIALSRARGLRQRIFAVLQPGRDLRAPHRAGGIAAMALAVAISIPAGTLHLAPTRNMLTRLMQDARWESRAYAVRGLAQRADSVRVAEDAAKSDPSPHVRAWARAALSAAPGATTPLNNN